MSQNKFICMNILLLRQSNPYIGSDASSNRFRGLIDGLCHEGHHVTIGVVGGLQKKYEDVNFKSPLDNIEVIYLSRANHYNGIIGRLNTYFFEWWHQIGVRKRFRRILNNNFDIIWLSNYYSVLNLYLKERAKIQGKTFIELNEFYDIYTEEKSSNFLQKWRGRLECEIFKKAIGKIDLFAVMTQTLLRYYQRMAKYDAKFIHLPMTVDITRFLKVSSSVEYIKPYIAFTGTMANHKDGVDVLIQAFSKIADKYPDLNLYLAGFWHYDVPMQDKMIVEYGLQERVHRLGTLSREQIPPFVCNASVLALSRPDSRQAQGGFPTKLGEYLSTGNPVCVTKVGEIADYLEDNVSAFLAIPGDVESFSDALNRALSDKSKAKIVGANGQKIAEEVFNVSVQSQRLSEFIVNNSQ